MGWISDIIFSNGTLFYFVCLSLLISVGNAGIYKFSAAERQEMLRDVIRQRWELPATGWQQSCDETKLLRASARACVGCKLIWRDSDLQCPDCGFTVFDADDRVFLLTLSFTIGQISDDYKYKLCHIHNISHILTTQNLPYSLRFCDTFHKQGCLILNKPAAKYWKRRVVFSFRS